MQMEIKYRFRKLLLYLHLVIGLIILWKMRQRKFVIMFRLSAELQRLAMHLLLLRKAIQLH
ncbi:hypothetical protein CLONEX_03552 [[Clostridium] nexile DSM 1787]|nr:hypothetical protein CLONEX_03552 [[Clostridium] nexile DSM 1787]RGY26031.1 hypothetical protein DXA47_08965 [[Clostridium] nexile]RHG11128.1 hypothetical protein DW638_13595 [[Clostridium] nexile]